MPWNTTEQDEGCEHHEEPSGFPGTEGSGTLSTKTRESWSTGVSCHFRHGRHGGIVGDCKDLALTKMRMDLPFNRNGEVQRVQEWLKKSKTRSTSVRCLLKTLAVMLGCKLNTKSEFQGIKSR